MDILERLRTAREPYTTSSAYNEARAHNAMLAAEQEIVKLREQFIQGIGNVLAIAKKNDEMITDAKTRLDRAGL